MKIMHVAMAVCALKQMRKHFVTIFNLSYINIHPLKAMDHSMFVSDFICKPVAFISVISVVLSGNRCVPLLIHSGLLI